MDMARHAVVGAGGSRHRPGGSVAGSLPQVPPVHAPDAGPVDRCCAVGTARWDRSGALAGLRSKLPRGGPALCVTLSSLLR